MAPPLPLPPPGFDDLSGAEKLDYLQSLWDRMAAHPDEVLVPDWHRELIEERLAEHGADPDDVTPWEDVGEAVSEKLRRDRG